MKKSKIASAEYVEIETKMSVIERYGSWDFMADFDDRKRTDIEDYSDWKEICYVTVEIREGEETFYAIQEQSVSGEYTKWELQETGDDQQTIEDVFQMIADDNCRLIEFIEA